MLCSYCKINNATKKSRSAITNKEVYLCNSCYLREKNTAFNTEVNFFSSILGQTFGGIKVVADKVCKNCNMHLSEFEKTGIAGCQNCYAVFSAEIENFVKRHQGQTVHIGKSPKSYKTFIELTQEKINMENELNLALKNNQTAKANKIKSDLTSLINHINSLNKGGEDSGK